MKVSPQASRTPSKLSISVHRQLTFYALAAGAAGVGMLALAQSAEGKIIYTKTNVSLFPFGAPLDLNNDGISDFYFLAHQMGTTGDQVSSVRIVSATGGNEIWWTGKNLKAIGPAVLRAGVVVGPQARLAGHSMLMGETLFNTTKGREYQLGPWENGGRGVTNRYLGLKFLINGQTHYAWARVNFPSPSAAVMTGYAYETIPNKPIITGKTRGPDVITVQPASLGRLAQGAAGLAASRSEK